MNEHLLPGLDKTLTLNEPLSLNEGLLHCGEPLHSVRLNELLDLDLSDPLNVLRDNDTLYNPLLLEALLCFRLLGNYRKTCDNTNNQKTRNERFH